MASQEVTVGAIPRDVALADFDGNGSMDLAVVNQGTGGSPTHRVTILSNNGSGNFSQTTQLSVTEAPNALAIGQFDGLLGPDIAVAVSGSIANKTINDGTVQVFLHTGGVSFAQSPFTQTVGKLPNSIVAADLDNDTVLDLAVANVLSNTTSVLYGRGNGNFGVGGGSVRRRKTRFNPGPVRSA